MTRITKIVALAFLAGLAASVIGDHLLWPAEPRQFAEQRFEISWWPAPRCPPPSSIYPRATRAL